MKNISLEEKEKIESINTRNNKLRDFLKEIKTENKSLGHKNFNDFNAKRAFEDKKTEQIDLPRLNNFKNEISSLQKNIEYIERKLLENANNTISSPLSTLNNQNEEFKNDFNNRFSYKTIDAHSMNYEKFPGCDNKKSFNDCSDKYKFNFNSNPFIEEPKKLEKNTHDYSQKYYSKAPIEPNIKQSVELPYKENVVNEYSFKEIRYKDRDNYNNHYNYERNNQFPMYEKIEKLSEKYNHSNNAAYEKNNYRYLTYNNTLEDNTINLTTKNNATIIPDHKNYSEENSKKNDYNLSNVNKSYLNKEVPLISEKTKTNLNLNTNDNGFLRYNTVDSNYETKIYTKKYNSPKHINYADSSIPILENNNENEIENQTNSKYTNTYEKSFTKNNRTFDYLEMQREISLREEEIRLLKLEIKRLNQEKEHYFSSLEQEKDKNKGYLDEIEKLKQIKDDLKVLNEKYDFLTHEYREITLKYDTSEQIRREQENLIISLKKEIEDKKSKKSMKHSRNSSRVDTKHQNKSEIKQEEEIRIFLKTEDNLNDDEEEEQKGSFGGKAFKTKEAKNSVKKKSKSKIKKNTDTSVVKTHNIKKINNNSKSSNLSSLSSNINKTPTKIGENKNLKPQKTLSKPKINTGTSKLKNTSSIAKKDSKGKMQKNN